MKKERRKFREKLKIERLLGSFRCTFSPHIKCFWTWKVLLMRAFKCWKMFTFGIGCRFFITIPQYPAPLFRRCNIIKRLPRREEYFQWHSATFCATKRHQKSCKSVQPYYEDFLPSYSGNIFHHSKLYRFCPHIVKATKTNWRKTMHSSKNIRNIRNIQTYLRLVIKKQIIENCAK